MSLRSPSGCSRLALIVVATLLENDANVSYCSLPTSLPSKPSIFLLQKGCDPTSPRDVVTGYTLVLGVMPIAGRIHSHSDG